MIVHTNHLVGRHSPDEEHGNNCLETDKASEVTNKSIHIGEPATDSTDTIVIVLLEGSVVVNCTSLR